MILFSSIADKNISEASLFQFDEWHPQVPSFLYVL